MNFKDKNILVAGGTSGIGLSLVKLLAKHGAAVYSLSRNTLNELPGNTTHIKMDVLKDVSALSLLLPEKLDGLVYAVGSINLKPFTRLTEDDFLLDYKLNMLGAVKVLQASLKALKNANPASVVLVSSVAAQTGMAFHASVAAAKSGVEGLARALAAELAPQHIRVNAVAPSLTDTPMTKSLLSSPEKKEASAKRHPMGRYGTPEDISGAIAFLLSDESAWVTGQVIGIDGGMGTLK